MHNTFVSFLDNNYVIVPAPNSSCNVDAMIHVPDNDCVIDTTPDSNSDKQICASKLIHVSKDRAKYESLRPVFGELPIYIIKKTLQHTT